MAMITKNQPKKWPRIVLILAGAFCLFVTIAILLDLLAPQHRTIWSGAMYLLGPLMLTIFVRLVIWKARNIDLASKDHHGHVD